jgi:CBS domain-containing protein
MRVSQLMTRPVRTCGPDDTLDVAARIMWQHEVSSVVVVEEGRAIGMITERDICLWAYSTGNPLWAIPVRQSMGTPPANIHTDATLEDAGQVLRAHHARGLPVTNDAGALVGVLSLEDLAIAA